MDLKNIRQNYNLAELNEATINNNPFELFSQWLKEAIKANLSEPTAMSVITMGSDGFPQSRIVLLKEFNSEGFTFFTNYTSDKGRAIEYNSKVGLHFFWPDAERQIRISGKAEKTNRTFSKTYFNTRPQQSQIAAVISEQSSEIASRKYLEDKFSSLQSQLKGANPHCPPNWGGYLVRPVKFEFWQGRANRLHDRIVFTLDNEEWALKRLAP